MRTPPGASAVGHWKVRNFAAEMVPFDPLVGEFRVHYAGFFDPGFGIGETGTGARGAIRSGYIRPTAKRS